MVVDSFKLFERTTQAVCIGPVCSLLHASDTYLFSTHIMARSSVKRKLLSAAEESMTTTHQGASYCNVAAPLTKLQVLI